MGKANNDFVTFRAFFLSFFLGLTHWPWTHRLVW